jgi:hypothetical protein
MINCCIVIPLISEKIFGDGIKKINNEEKEIAKKLRAHIVL